MTVGDKDCCARKDCGHGEVWHPECCQSHRHRFIEPLVIGEKVLLVGDKFWYDFPGDKDFPKDPKGWVKCRFNGADGTYYVIAKPDGFGRFDIDKRQAARFSLSKPAGTPTEAGEA